MERPSRRPDDGAAAVAAHRADFADPAALNALRLPPLDGVLLANALHFVPAGRQAAVLGDLVLRLADGGRLVVIEYENRAASRWVPAPVSFARLSELAAAVRDGGVPVASPVRTGERPSAFGGTMYVAFLTRGA